MGVQRESMLLFWKSLNDRGAGKLRDSQYRNVLQSRVFIAVEKCLSRD